MMVQITQAPRYPTWYQHRVGEEYEVHPYRGRYYILEDGKVTGSFIRKQDAKVIVREER